MFVVFVVFVVSVISVVSVVLGNGDIPVIGARWYRIRYSLFGRG